MQYVGNTNSRCDCWADEFSPILINHRIIRLSLQEEITVVFFISSLKILSDLHLQPWKFKGNRVLTILPSHKADNVPAQEAEKGREALLFATLRESGVNVIHSSFGPRAGTGLPVRAKAQPLTLERGMGSGSRNC